MAKRFLLLMTHVVLIVLLVACTRAGSQADTQDLLATWVAGTLTAVASMPAFPTLTPTSPQLTFPASFPTASNTPLPLPTSIPLNPLVLETTLCWEGPGSQFEVVSALKKDERVEVIGRASISGWWIVDNPIYHDPCWVQARYLQLEPGFNPLTLPVFTPRPTPTFTITETRTPTNTPTPSATHTP